MGTVTGCPPVTVKESMFMMLRYVEKMNAKFQFIELIEQADVGTGVLDGPLINAASR